MEAAREQGTDALLSSARLKVLREIPLLNTGAEESFDRLARLVTRLLRAPIALVSLVEADRQIFKSCIGLPQPWASLRQTPLTHSFCQHCVTSGRNLIVSDARQHPLLRNNLAIRDLGVIAYAGVPLITSDGFVLGSFCAIDCQPRNWTEADICTLSDLGAAVMTEIELRRSEAAYQRLALKNEQQADLVNTVLSVSPDPVFMVNASGRCTYASPAALKLLGRQAREVYGKALTESGLAASASEHLDLAARAALETGKEQRGAFELASSEGPRCYEHAASPIVGIDGRANAVVIAARDVTDRLRAESALRESERNFRMVTEALPHMIWSARADGFSDYYNTRFLQYLGTTLQQMQGWTWTTMLHPQDVARAMEAWTRAFTSGDTFTAEFRLRRAVDGMYRWHVAHATPIRDESGRVVRWFGTCTDVHEEREHLRELAEAKAALEQATLAKDQFLSVLSHELRNPVAPVLMTAGMLEADPSVPEPVQAELRMIRRNVQMQVRLIDDLLDITRIGRGKLELRREPARVHELLRQTSQMCQADLRDKRIELRADLRATNDGAYVDPARLQQVFLNVLKNAIKFTPAGGSITVTTTNAPDQALRVEVTDTGIGIDPGNLATIFNAYEQGGTAVTRRFGGLGLGLAICKALVEAHGGRITAHSEGAGCGATFLIELRASPLGADPRTTGPASAAPATGRSLRILLVEDHESTARAMVKLLRKMQHVVVAAGSVDAALQAAASESFDLIISDLGLPDGSGLDLMRELRRLYPVRGIALTGYGMEQDVDRSLEAGFAEHLTKPVDADRLRAVIQRVAQ